MGGVRQAVKRAVAEDRIVEETKPLVDAPVGGQDEAGAAVALDDQLVEVAALLGGQAVEAEGGGPERSERISSSGAR